MIPAANQFKGKQFDFFVATVLGILGFAVYSNTFDAAFHVDDSIRIVLNSSIHMEEFSWGRLLRSYNPEYPFERPISYMSFALNYYFGGLEVFGYHLVNIIIHIFTGIGVYLLIKTILTLPSIHLRQGNEYLPHVISASTAALWLTSPVQTQGVTYIVQRMASMGAMFYIYSLLFYVKGRVNIGKKRTGYISLAIILFLLAIGTKETTITLIFMIILCEVSFFRRPSSGFLRERWFILLVSACIVVVAGFIYVFWEFFDLAALSFLKMGYGMQERVFTEARVIVYYMLLLLIPVPSKLALFHDFPLSRGLINPFTTLPALLSIAAIMMISLYRLKRDPLVSFFTLWFFINVIPESLHVGLGLIYEHRLYLPSVGFYFLMAFLTFRLLDMARLKMTMVISCMVLSVILLFSINTYARNEVWHDDLSMWKDNAEKAPMLARPHEGLGMAYLERGRLEDAEREFRFAKSLDPLSSVAGIGLGIVNYNRGDYAGAFREFEYVTSRRGVGAGSWYISPDIIFYKIGEDFLKMGRLEDALKVFRMGLAFNPENAEILRTIARLEGGL